MPNLTPRSTCLFFTLAAGLVLAGGASAQATRTWVSGVGDDANPCSRTAPCKTFAGAISKTAPAGEINVLDPGGFGAVTITKAITISSEGFEAGVLVSGTNGIIVNAGLNDTVVLRGLDIEGLGTGLSGIRFLAGGALHVEKCTINNFTTTAIDFEPNNAIAQLSQLFVDDTVIRNNSGSAAGGILVKPVGSNSAKASISNTRVEENTGGGLRAETNANVSISHSVFTGNTNSGIIGVLGAVIHVESSVSSNNQNGIKSDVPGTLVTISNVTVSNNSTMGLNTSAGGTIKSFGNNHVSGNASDGVPTAPNLSPI